MDWHNAPIGTIRREKLLNALLAIWRTERNITNRGGLDKCSEEYKIGFEEGLDAIAQMAGLIEEFESGKAVHYAKLKARLESQFELIDTQAICLEEG